MSECYFEYTNEYKKLIFDTIKIEEFSVIGDKIPNNLKIRFICENNKMPAGLLIPLKNVKRSELIKKYNPSDTLPVSTFISSDIIPLRNKFKSLTKLELIDELFK